MHFIKEHIFLIAGIVIGALAGFAYYYFIGCSSGTCPITSQPVNSTVYGAVMGGLFFNLLKKSKSNSTNKK